ncbi:MAG: M23 family metallopeptidase [Sandaracinus sp.]
MRYALSISAALLALAALPAGVSAQEETQEDEHALLAAVHLPGSESVTRAHAEPAPADPTRTGHALHAIGRVDLQARTPEAWWSHGEESMPLEPARQRARMPRQCRTRGGYRRYCQGERIVPTPSGPSAELAAWLGLGHRATALQMMHEPAFDEWRAATAGVDDETRLTFPVPEGHMGRGFGYTRDAGLAHTRHDGVDIGAPEGSDIVAARGGLVMYADNGITGMGNVLIVLHGDGSSALYAHCREIFVFAGQYVERGQRVAVVGETGFARAPHLHFEWRRNGSPHDPAHLFLPRHADEDDTVDEAVAHHEHHEHHHRSHREVADLHAPRATADRHASLATRDGEDE